MGVHMKQTLIAILAISLWAFPVAAQDSALEGAVETRIGTLNFDRGFPADETVEKLYDELDFQRAVQAYIWGLPMVEMAEWKRAQVEDFGAGPYDFVTYLTAQQKMGILTANATTPYVMAFPNLLETGPLVYELPAGPTAGGFMDFWQRPVTDLGQTGPDKGNGAKVLILGPEHEEINPDGYLVFRSPTWHIMVASRVLHPDPVESKKMMDAHKLYPYAERQDPPESRLISSEGIEWAAHQPRGVEYFNRMASIVEVEPVERRDFVMMSMLEPLGIKPGGSFAPDARLEEILSEAALVGEAMARANGYAKRFDGARLWPSKRWELALFITQTSQDLPTRMELDERASWFYEAIGVSDGMMGKTLGAGQIYIETQKDDDDEWLDGGQAYKLTIPADAPMKQFWSLSVYDSDTRCLVQTGELPDKSSRMDLNWNEDGSVDLYFGPEPPKDERFLSNWIKTVPGRGWFTYFRLYAPTERYFDRSWELEDIEKVD